MKRILKKILLKFYSIIFNKQELPQQYGVDKRFSRIAEIFNQYGYINTLNLGEPLDFNLKPIPWYTYPAIHFLDQLDISKKTVFEWGSGNSSLFYANRCEEVVSIENHKDWYAKISSTKRENQTIHLVENDLESYVNIIKRIDRKYDIIVIDGELFRTECSKIALNYLNNGGIIILDNSDWFKNAAKELNNANLIQVDFHGFGPINDYTWTTTFYFHQNYKFSYKGDLPSYSIGGLNHLVE